MELYDSSQLQEHPVDDGQLLFKKKFKEKGEQIEGTDEKQKIYFTKHNMIEIGETPDDSILVLCASGCEKINIKYDVLKLYIYP